MENLPRAVLSNIFIRLLAKQLAQMRSICKSWNALLSEYSFVKSHLHHSINYNDEILLFLHQGFSFDRSQFRAHPSRSPDRELTNLIKLPVNPQSKYIYGDVIGSVNGLICFYYASYSFPSRNYVIYIWNPSLSVILTLPPCSNPSSNLLPRYTFRFGFDPNTDDYKVVKLTRILQQGNMVRQVEVYSMRKGSWEIITQTFPSHTIILTHQAEVCIDGHDGRLHWLCANDFEWKLPMIVAFDLGAETFCEILVPDSRKGRCINLGVLGGKLCVISRVQDGGCEVWVMNEYGVSESWVKHHVFSQFGGGISPYGFTLQNEYLFQVDYDHFALYDPVTDKCKTFEVRPSQCGLTKIVEYVDSLVWVAPGDRSCCNISQFHF